MTELDAVNYILNQSIELKITYCKYQELLQLIREKDYDIFLLAINNIKTSVSYCIKISI